MTTPAPSATDAPTEATFTESLNFKVSKPVKQRLVSEAKRLEMTQTSVQRLCLALGLEAVERLTAVEPEEGLGGR